MEWYLPNEKPINISNTSLTDIVFCDDHSYHIGKTGPDSKWYPNDGSQALEGINGWAFLPDAPIVLTAGNIEQDWIAGNGPVPSAFSHFLLYDHEVISVEDLNGPYFDVQNRTFKDITHHIILPKIPLRLSGRGFIVKQKDAYLMELFKNPSLKALKVDIYLDRCLFIAFREVYNTTTNGMRRIHLVQGDALTKEIFNRWIFQANNGINKAEGKDFIRQKTGTVTPPANQNDRDKIKIEIALLTLSLAAM